MHEHDEINDLVPFYATGNISENDRRKVERHLESCAECRADLVLWQMVGGEVSAAGQNAQPPANLIKAVTRQIRSGSAFRWASPLQRAWLILISQVPLVRREIWPASAAVIALGIGIALLGYEVNVIQYFAPLIAAATISIIYGPEVDPGYELACATPTTPRQILFARLTLVFSYNLTLVMIGSLLLIPLLTGEVFSALVMSWLAPMTFLSSLTLLLSISIGSGNAVSLTYLAWMVNIFSSLFDTSGLFQNLLEHYTAFWNNPTALFLASAGLVAAALVSVGRLNFTTPRTV